MSLVTNNKNNLNKYFAQLRHHQENIDIPNTTKLCFYNSVIQIKLKMPTCGTITVLLHNFD